MELLSSNDYTTGERISDAEIKLSPLSGYSNDLTVSFSRVANTTAEFMQLSSSQRGCYFEDEVKLDFFPQYSKANCLLECAWNRAKHECGCVPWFLKEHHFPAAWMCNRQVDARGQQ